MKPKKNILLCFDTSSPCLSLALFKEETLIDQHEETGPNIHSNRLALSIGKLLEKNHLHLDQVDYLGVGLGPGSFTGLRVGLATAKALIYQTPTKLVASESLIALAEESDFKGRIGIISNAKKSNLYLGIYRRKTDGRIFTECVPKIIKEQDFLKTRLHGMMVLGDAAAALKDKIKTKWPDAVLIEKLVYPKARFLARSFFAKIKSGKFEKPERINPLYLYAKDCNVTKKD